MRQRPRHGSQGVLTCPYWMFVEQSLANQILNKQIRIDINNDIYSIAIEKQIIEINDEINKINSRECKIQFRAADLNPGFPRITNI